MKKTFRLVTLGCRTNQYETQGYRDQLLKLGFREAEEGEGATLCIVNTCTVTASADSGSRHAIRRLIRENPGAKVVVTGCLVDNQKTPLDEIEGIYKIIPNKDKESLIASLFPEEEIAPFMISHFEGHTRAFVKVQDGCNSFCSYCIIPYVRGRSRSRTIEDVVSEVKALVDSGYKEVVITGINVGDFDGQKEDKLADLIKAVDRVEGLKRLRLSSIDPDEVDEALIEAILEGKTTCPSLHIVLQSGSNVILKKMRRKYTRQIFLETVEKLKKRAPHFTFTTDVIVGFPGETEADFEETLDVISEVKFAHVHMFPYSRRERTKAYFFPDQVPHEVIMERKQQVLRASEKASFALRSLYLNQKMTLLTEGIDGEMIFGHTENFLPVRLPKATFQPNQLVDVELIENTERGLVARTLVTQK